MGSSSKSHRALTTFDRGRSIVAPGRHSKPAPRRPVCSRANFSFAKWVAAAWGWCSPGVAAAADLAPEPGAGGRAGTDIGTGCLRRERLVGPRSPVTAGRAGRAHLQRCVALRFRPTIVRELSRRRRWRRPRQRARRPARGRGPVAAGQQDCTVDSLSRLRHRFPLDGGGTPSGGFFWDGRVSSLAEQARRPFFNAVEMALASPADLAARLAKADY